MGLMLLKYAGTGLFAALLTARALTVPAKQLPLRHALNLGLAYAALALLALALAIGPLARLEARFFGRLVTVRREIGVAGGLLALAHVVLSTQLHVKWQFPAFFFNLKNGRIVELNDRVDGIANWLGLAALLLLVPLLLTSNDRAERFLGAPGWKWLQSHAYTLFALVAFHTAIFLQVAAKGRARPDSFWLVFWLAVGGVLALQALAFAITIARRRARLRRPASRPAPTLGAPVLDD